MQTRILATGLALILLAAVAPAARAGTIYDNFGSGDSYVPASWAISGPSSPTFSEIDTAAPFTPGTTAQVGSIELPLIYVQGTNSLVVKLLGDSSGLPDEGTVLESWTLSGISDSSTIYTLTSLVNPTVTAGTQYWVAAFAGASDSLHGWNYNNTGVTGFATDQHLGSGWTLWTSSSSLTPAFRVSVVPLPDTGSMGLGLLTLLGTVYLFRRSKAAF